MDLYRPLVAPRADDAHSVGATRWFTVMWGAVAVGFALFASLAENLIQAVNIVASIFYGVVLGLFLVAFFLRRVQGTAVFWAAIAAQLLVFALFAILDISYLWYNLIGCAACVGFSLALQAALGPSAAAYRHFPSLGRPWLAAAWDLPGWLRTTLFLLTLVAASAGGPVVAWLVRPRNR